MAQRRKISGGELTPSASQHVGMLNAEKCVRYLRGIGVEVDDTTAESWLDAQAVHRFLASGRSTWRRVDRWSCRCGGMSGLAESGRGQHKDMRDWRKKSKKEPRKPRRCESCDSGFVCMELVFYVTRDGAVRDYRRGVEAVTPLRLDEFAGGL